MNLVTPDAPAAAVALAAYAAVVFDPTDHVELRLIDASRKVSKRWTTAGGLPRLAEWLATANADGRNVFAGVNGRRGRGMSGDAAVGQCRCLVADHDGIALDAARAAWLRCWLPDPTMVIQSGHGVHAYWLLDAALAPAAWRVWQSDLAAALGSDPAVCNPERVMRLPGFLNVKFEPAVPCVIAECDPARVYGLADLSAVTRVTEPPPLYTWRRQPRPDEGGGDRVARCRAYLDRCPRAVAGQQGHKTTWFAACTCVRFGLSESDALDVLRWYSCMHCDPPWSEREIAHKVADAYRRNGGQHGQMLERDRDRDRRGNANGKRGVLWL